MIKLGLAIATALSLTACGGGGGGSTTSGGNASSEVKRQEVRQLDPNPPMSGSDIDSIVKETRARDASRGGSAVTPPVDNAATTTN